MSMIYKYYWNHLAPMTILLVQCNAMCDPMKRQPVPLDFLAALTAQALFAADGRRRPGHDVEAPGRWRRNAGRWLAGLRRKRTASKDTP
jgi:hypothetical protein